MATYETIGYPVVGEKEKLADNVIGYNIREEQSISGYSVLTGASSVSNGQATLVYGVNAPKLIQSTSIYKDKSDVIPSFSAKIHGTIRLTPEEDQLWIYNYTISEEVGDYKFIQTDRGIEFPVEGNYKVDFTYSAGTSRYYYQYRTRKDSGGVREIIDDFTWDYSQYGTNDATASKIMYFNAGDVLASYIRIYTTYTAWTRHEPYITYVITKI